MTTKLKCLDCDSTIELKGTKSIFVHCKCRNTSIVRGNLKHSIEYEDPYHVEIWDYKKKHWENYATHLKKKFEHEEEPMSNAAAEALGVLCMFLNEEIADYGLDYTCYYSTSFWGDYQFRVDFYPLEKRGSVIRRLTFGVHEDSHVIRITAQIGMALMWKDLTGNHGNSRHFWVQLLHWPFKHEGHEHRAVPTVEATGMLPRTQEAMEDNETKKSIAKDKKLSEQTRRHKSSRAEWDTSRKEIRNKNGHKH